MDRSKGEEDEEQQAFLGQSGINHDISQSTTGSPQKATSHLRWIVEALMAITIAVLLIRPLVLNKGTSKPSPVPRLPRKVYTFAEDPKYMHGDMFFDEKDTLHTLHNWIELSSASRGYVQFHDAASYDLPKPYITPVNRTSDGPGYMMSVYHQLHCLSYIVRHFQTGFAGVELTEEVAHHSAHCFDYLRQSIMCAADTTLEGDTELGPGWGSKHECTDYDALLEWANEHATMKWRNNLPDEATL